MDKLEEEWTSLMSIYSGRAGKAFCHMASSFHVFFDPPKAGDKVFTQLEDIAKMARMYNGGIQFEEDRTLLQELSEGSSEPELQKKVAQKILDMSLTKILQRHLKGLKEAQGLNRKIPKRLELWKDDNVQAGPNRKDFIQSLKTKLQSFSNFVGHHSLVLACLDLKLKEQSRLNKKTKTLISKTVKANRKLLQSFSAKRSSDESEMEGENGVNKGQATNVRLIQVQPNNQMEDTTDSEESFSGDSEGDKKEAGVRVIQVKPRNPDTPFYTAPTAFRTPKLSTCPTVSTKGQAENEMGQLAPKGPREAFGHTPSQPPSPPGASNSGQTTSRVEEPMPRRVPRPPKAPCPYRAPNSPSGPTPNQDSVPNTVSSARQRRIAAKATSYCTYKDSAPSSRQHPVPTQATSTSQDSVFTKAPSTTQGRILKQTTGTPHDSVHNKVTSAPRCQIQTQATSPSQESRLNKASIPSQGAVPAETPSLPQDPLPHQAAIGSQEPNPCQSTSQADIIPENATVQACGKLDPVLIKMAPKAAWEGPNELSKLSNVYVRVTTPYKSRNKTELSLKVGQKLKQKTPADDKGFAFGWTRANRLAPKRWGFYPVSCVKLVPDKTH